MLSAQTERVSPIDFFPTRISPYIITKFPFSIQVISDRSLSISFRFVLWWFLLTITDTKVGVKVPITSRTNFLLVYHYRIFFLHFDSVYVSLPICLFISTYPFVYIYIYLYIYRFIALSFGLLAYLSIHPLIYLCRWIFIYQNKWIPICLS